MPDTIHVNVCPLCGAVESVSELTCTDHYASHEEFTICRCAACNFRFTQDAPDENAIGRYYDTPDYISHSDTRRGLMNRVYHYVRGYMLNRKARLLEKHTPHVPGRLLDIGTGTGYFPDTMQRRGWMVEAIERNESARDFAKRHFGLQVRDENAWEDLQGRFDVITMWHVMEHIRLLDDLWGNLHRLLSDDGILIVAVPNCQSFDAHKYQRYWAAYDLPRHLWHFTPETMRKWGHKHGFRMECFYPMPMDAFYISMMSERYQGHSQSFLRGCLTGLRAYTSSLGHKERSSSLIYIFRKE